MKLFRLKKPTSFQWIILGFAGVILAGAFLLMLPISSSARTVTPFHDALFTSTSAVCVTGLVVRDTGSYWSVFGKVVLLLLIQIGGLGVITVAAAFAILSGKKISLMQRSTLQEATAAPQVGGIVRLTGFILRGTLLVEGIGALLMMPVFCKDYGFRGVFLSCFHSVSAFCNAGFDLLGTGSAAYPSLTAYADNPLICVPVMLLILAGGIGFLTWEDIGTHGIRFRRYRMQSKVILLTSAFLIVLPTVYFFFFEFTGGTVGQRLLNATFQAITPRTAGFNTVNLSEMSGASCGIMIFLMLIGGAPGSTAGGMKMTTLAVLLANLFAVFRRREDVCLFGRRVDDGAVRTAASIGMMDLLLFFGGALVISTAEGLPMSVCLYETASAVATVGLTLGVTPGLGILSQAVLILLMFLGRVGGLTLIYAALRTTVRTSSRLPQEKIMIG